MLPQFVGAHAGFVSLAVHALTLTVIGALVLIAIVFGASRARAALSRARVQRGIEAGTGVVMIGFAAALAADA